VLDLQSEHISTGKGKGKQKASAPDDSNGEEISSELDVHMDDPDPEDDLVPIVPLPQSESIEALRAKLRAKIETMRSRKRGEGNSKDDLLEERRLQRGAMRERRRKETKEKIRKEKESKGKSKEKPKDAAPPTKVSFTHCWYRFRHIL
jgi:hypothetical protein